MGYRLDFQSGAPKSAVQVRPFPVFRAFPPDAIVQA
jgi:hypothetical protein